MKAFYHIALALSCAAPALASVTVSSPVNGATVTSPFALKANASSCSSQAIASMGYSLDSSSSTTIVKSSSLSASVAASLGSHIVHVKSWGTEGAACSASMTVNVEQAPTPSTTTNITVASPLNGTQVVSPVPVAATGTLCKGQPIAAMGYSLDSSSTTVFKSQAISGSVSAATGSHTLHVKAWGNAGASCAVSLSVSVQAPPPVKSGPSIPTDAIAVKSVQNFDSWGASYDTRTSGSASGATQLVATPAISGSARRFATSYTDYAGERYHVSLKPATEATDFVYDSQIYVANPSSDISNIEMDLNQVAPNGQTIIYGFQCDGWSHTWDYAENSGTPTSPRAHWLHSNQTCYPQKWATGTWHRVQIQYSRDNSGNVTYKAVWLDGVEQDLNITVASSFALGWQPTLLINFQIDGATSTSGSSTVYLDNTTIYSW
jgi:hypothetical protein